MKDEVEQLVKDPESRSPHRSAAVSDRVRSRPIRCERIEQLGDFEDFSIRAAVVAFLARPGRTQNVDAARLLLSKMVEEPGEDGPRARGSRRRG